MSTINLNVEINPETPKVAEALSTLILIMGGCVKAPNPSFEKEGIDQVKGEAVISPIKKVKSARAEAYKTLIESNRTEILESNSDAEPVLDQDQKDAEGEYVPPVENETEESQIDKVTLEQVREALGKKVSDHRDVVKAELTRLNAKNVSGLSAEHYSSFKSFLDKL